MTRCAILFATIFGLAACETVGGFGEDMQNPGDEDTANDLEAEM